MKALDKVYIHTTPHLGLLEATAISVNASGEQEYIRKEALMEWAKENRDSLGRLSYGEFIDKLNEM